MLKNIFFSLSLLAFCVLAASSVAAPNGKADKAPQAEAAADKPQKATPVAKGRPTDNPAKEKAIPNIEKNNTPATEKAVPVVQDLPWKDIERPSDKG